MIYLVFSPGETIIGCFRDPQEAQEYIEMIKEISARYYRENESMYMKPAKMVQKMTQKYIDEITQFISKHLPTKILPEQIPSYAEKLLDAILEDFEVFEVPLTSFHLQEKLTESIRIKIHV